MPSSPEPKLAFSTLGCPDWTWRDLLQKGPENGFQGVEIRLVARETDLLQLPEFRPKELPQRVRELGDAGLVVCGLASSVRFDEPGSEARNLQLTTGRQYVDLAKELGGEFVRVFGDVLPKSGSCGDELQPAERADSIQWIAEGLNALGEYGEQMEIDILLETHGDFSNSRLVQETMQQVQSPRVGVLWDTHHPWRFVGEELGETFQRLRPWVRHTHWKDSVVGIDSERNDPSKSSDSATSRADIDEAAQRAHALMSGHQHADYVLFGEGEFPIDRCLRLLQEAGYSGWYSLEWEKMWHPEIAEPETALPVYSRDMRHRLAALRKG